MATAITLEVPAPQLGIGASRNDLLIRAAHDLLDESGLEGLTIRAVLNRSGLARRAFYEQFGGKDDLVLAVFERTLSFAAEYFGAQAHDAADPVQALQRIVTGLVIGQLGFGHTDSGRRSAALSREHLRLAESRPQELQKALSPLLALLTDEIARGVAAGVLRPCDPALQASLVYNFVSATVHVELLSDEGGTPDRARREELAGTIWEFCRRAVIA